MRMAYAQSDASAPQAPTSPLDLITLPMCARSVSACSPHTRAAEYICSVHVRKFFGGSPLSTSSALRWISSPRRRLFDGYLLSASVRRRISAPRVSVDGSPLHVSSRNGGESVQSRLRTDSPDPPAPEPAVSTDTGLEPHEPPYPFPWMQLMHAQFPIQAALPIGRGRGRGGSAAIAQSSTRTQLPELG